MEEKWIRDPLSGILLSIAFIGYGIYLVLAAMGTADWDQWWGFLLIAMGFPLALEFPIRYVTPGFRIRGGPFSRQLIGVILLCLGIGGVFGFKDWWPALLFIAVGWAILTFSLWRWQTPKQSKRPKR